MVQTETPTNAGVAGQTATATAMDCDEFDMAIAEALSREELPPTARQHLAECGACAAKVGDFEAIAEQVRQLGRESEAAVPNQWQQIRTVLQNEGVIHDREHPCPPAAPRLVRRK